MPRGRVAIHHFVKIVDPFATASGFAAGNPLGATHRHADPVDRQFPNLWDLPVRSKRARSAINTFNRINHFIN